MSRPELPAWPEGTDAARELASVVAKEANAEAAPPVGARARVWARLSEQRQRRARRPLAVALGVAGATAAVLAALVVHNVMAPSTLAGVRLDAEAARRVDLRSAHGGARLALDGDTRAVVARDDAEGLFITLERGSLLCDVEHRPAGAPFLVRTPRATVRVVGTVLWVSVDEAGEATVLVGRGAVRVERSAPAADRGSEGGAVPVGAGERWPSASSAAPSRRQLALLSDRLEGTRFAAPTAAPRSAPAPPAPAPSTASSADCAALRGVAAIACFQTLSTSRDPLRAESALFEMGWRQLRDLGDARAALATWTTQRDRFPDGVLRMEADTSIVQAAIRLGDRARARREAEAWLAAHPGGLAAPEIHYHLGATLRGLGDCRAALPHLEAALRSGAGSYVADARLQRDACRRR